MTAHQYEPGDILLAYYPFTDHTAAKIRPVLVISQRRFNFGRDFVIVPLSSRIKSNDQYGYVIKDTDSYFGQTGLKMSSTVKWTKPMTVTVHVIERRLGKLPQAPLADVVALMVKLFQGESEAVAVADPPEKPD